ncbi:hypothetical protein WCWAEYFT_CDS0002 [Vibrio phage VB_VaC_TDDLMA]
MNFKEYIQLGEAKKTFVVVPGKGSSGTVMHLYSEAKEFKKFEDSLNFMRENKYTYYRIMLNEGRMFTDEEILNNEVFLSGNVMPLIDLIKRSSGEIVYSLGFGKFKELDDEDIKKLKMGKRVS